MPRPCGGVPRVRRYSLKGGELVSSSVNEGRPVQLRLQAGVLVLMVDELLVFHLRRI